MSKITGRRDDMLVIRGVNIYPSEVERVLLGEARAEPGLPAGSGRAGAGPDLLACCEYRAGVRAGPQD